MKDDFIDIEEIIKSKNKKLFKMLPLFIINYLKKILHQNQINKVLSDNNSYQGLDFAQRMLDEFEIRTETDGEENIPENGKFIFVANHPLGSFDGIAFMTILGKRYGITKSVVNDLLLNVKNYEPLFIGVNKHGKTGRDAIMEMDEVFKSDYQVILYPAGLASRRKKGIIRDLEWKKTFITRAKKYQRDIIPVHITGNLSNFFYKLANLRTKLGIKANIEMLYLVDETFKQKGKTLTFKFGKPISYKTFSKEKTDKEWGQLVKNHVYKIGEENINSDFKY